MRDAASLPRDLYDARGTRELDRTAMTGAGIPGIELMNRAGEAAFACLRDRWPDVRRVSVVCGGGNNGGDGFVVARLARQAGFAVDLRLLGEVARVQGDAALAMVACKAAGVEVLPWCAGSAPNDGVIVDALFGTGLDRPLVGEARAAVDVINKAALPVLALDLPSGLHADTGAVLGAAVRATATISFIGLKPGLLTGSGPAYAGAVSFDALGVPSAVYDGVRSVARRIELDDCRAALAPRPADAHKGHFGHVLVIGGDLGYAGAAGLAAGAAARCGAGLVSVATRAAHAAALLAGRLELMVHGVDGADALRALLASASVVVIGPGLGRGEWGRRLFDAALDQFAGPMVVDADALNLLAGRDLRRHNWVLTPHPGEAGRLLRSDSKQVQANRFAAAAGIVERHGGCVVLKGAGSVVASEGPVPGVCTQGNPGMASGGMGDVLSGVIAALLAQGQAVRAAAELGVCLHAGAADLAAVDGERGLLASDLFGPLRRLVNPR